MIRITKLGFASTAAVTTTLSAPVTAAIFVTVPTLARATTVDVATVVVVVLGLFSRLVVLRRLIFLRTAALLSPVAILATTIAVAIFDDTAILAPFDLFLLSLTCLLSVAACDCHLRRLIDWPFAAPELGMRCRVVQARESTTGQCYRVAEASRE
jgi:hypothetical protein